MPSKKGKKYENSLVVDFYNETGDNVSIHPCGFSGNHATPSADVLVTTNHGCYGFELKRTGREKGYRMHTEDEKQAQQLAACVNDHTRAFFGVRFDNRELMVAELDDPSRPVESVCENVPDCFNPRIGSQSGDLRVDDPWVHDEDSWPSQTAGRSDVDVLAAVTGVWTGGVSVETNGGMATA